MFTGIIDHTGTLTTITPIAAGVALTIRCNFTDLSLGESIAVDGVCLTVCALQPGQFSVELSTSTLAVTNASYYSVGQRVNLERSLAAGGRFGGHFVTGHVDKTVRLLTKRTDGEFQHWSIGPFSAEEQPWLVNKGSLSVNGVSLTIQALIANTCELMLIPHTLSHTSFAGLKVGATLNLEFDMLAKLVAKQTSGARHEHSF